MKAKYILSIMALLIGASCSDDNENTPGFTLDEKEIQMEAVGGTREVHVLSTGQLDSHPQRIMGTDFAHQRQKFGDLCHQSRYHYIGQQTT